MPREPTQKAREACLTLRRIVSRQSELTKPLPTVRELAVRLEISYSSVSRMLTELSQEGVVWQHPNRRFYPKSAQAPAGRGLPVVLIGRQIQSWSQLYRETIEGISEVCSALGSPLVLLSSDLLVNHSRPDNPPAFASESLQGAELTRLEALVSRPCSAILFDHLWTDQILAGHAPRIASSCVILMRSTALPGWGMARPDFHAGANLMLRHLVECGYDEIQMASPFAGDYSVGQCMEAFEKAAAGAGKIQLRPAVNCGTPLQRQRYAAVLRQTTKRIAVVVPEDNIAMLLAREFSDGIDGHPERVGVASLQGTGIASAPLTRIRYDYRRLGRSLTKAVLTGECRDLTVSPSLIEGRSTMVLPTNGNLRH